MKVMYVVVLTVFSLFAGCEAQLRRLSLAHDPHNPNSTATKHGLHIPSSLKKLAHSAQEVLHDAEQAVEDSIQGVIHNVAPSLEDSFSKHRLTKPIAEDALGDLLLHGAQENTDGATSSK